MAGEQRLRIVKDEVGGTAERYGKNNPISYFERYCGCDMIHDFWRK